MRKHTTDGYTATERGKAMVGKLTMGCPERREDEGSGGRSCKDCSTVLSAAERQSSGQLDFARPLQSALASTRRHKRDYFIVNFAWSKHPSDKIIEIIHSTTGTST